VESTQINAELEVTKEEIVKLKQMLGEARLGLRRMLGERDLALM